MIGPSTKCTAERHGASADAYRKGCRCPQALEAQEEKRAADRARSSAKWANRAEPSEHCTAAKHGVSVRAYASGCRCDAAVAAYQAKLVKDCARSAERPHTSKERYVAARDEEPNYVDVWLVATGRKPFRHLETAADREAALIELGRAA